MTPPDAIAIVVVAYNSADALGATLGGLAGQLREGDEVCVVDNASADGSAAVARRALPSADVFESGSNGGFAAGCHAGVRRTRAPLVLLLNPDCTPAPGCLDALRRCAAEHPDWGAWQALVLLPADGKVNTAGNDVHFLGFGWAGGLGDAVTPAVEQDREVGFASGAALCVRRGDWDALGGFDERYFMYGEDLDLSLRLRLAGRGVGIAGAARVDHEYAFTKGEYKWYLLERNRWWTIVSVYPRPLLRAVLPALLAFELLLLPAAWHGGWLRAKLRAQAAVVRELPAMLRRRREVQAARTVSAQAFADGFVATLDSPMFAGPRSIPGAESLPGVYWRMVRAVLR